jgi:hypothetical protein
MWYLIATPFGLALLQYAAGQAEAAPRCWHRVWSPIGIACVLLFGPGAIVFAAGAFVVVFS